MKPIVHDLYCGLGGWAQGFLAEDYEVIGYDIEKHDYGTGTYPGKLIICDVLGIHGSQLKDAAVIVASPPCQEPSYRAMPWSRFSYKSDSRKAASAEIAKIPFPLAQHIARCFKPILVTALLLLLSAAAFAQDIPLPLTPVSSVSLTPMTPPAIVFHAINQRFVMTENHCIACDGQFSDMELYALLTPAEYDEWYFRGGPLPSRLMDATGALVHPFVAVKFYYADVYVTGGNGTLWPTEANPVQAGPALAPIVDGVLPPNLAIDPVLGLIPIGMAGLPLSPIPLPPSNLQILVVMERPQ